MKIKPTNGVVKPLVAATAFGVVGATLAITDAGTVIKNLATVTYTDSNGDSYTATSNEAEVTVAPVFTATLENDNLTVNGAPGQTVYFPHVLTNSGNTEDTYTIFFGDDDLTGAGGSVAAGGFTAYIDENGNGQPDAGEQVLTSGGTVTLPADSQVSIILAVDIPATADAGDTIDGAIVARSNGGGEVTDSGIDTDGDVANGGSALGGGVAATDATNQNLVTVTLGPVLVTTKASEYMIDVDAVNAGNQPGIEYTLTVKNVGGSAATNVDIFDAIPASVAGISFFEITEINGLIDGTDSWYNDATPGFDTDLGTLANIVTTDDFDEPSDINDNGATDTDVTAILLRDASLGANVTISIKYTVTVPAGAGDVYRNIFCAGQDITSSTSATTFDFDATDIAQCSNQTVDEIPETYGVTISDRGTGADADSTDNDVDAVASGALGGNVDFTNVVTNNGTSNDIFDLTVAGDTFPAGTVFTFWEANGFVPLTDNNNNGIPDTGVIGSGSSESIIVRATLPQDVEDGDAVTSAGLAANDITGGTIATSGNSLFLDKVLDGTIDEDGADATLGQVEGYVVAAATTASDDEKFQVVIVATSTEDASQTDATIDALGTIGLPIVDLANATGATGFNDAGVADAHVLAATPVFTFGNNVADDDGQGNGAVSGNGGTDNDDPVQIGQTVYFPLFIANEGLNLDAYTLSHDYTGTDFVVEFKQTNTAEAPVITATPALSSGETFAYFAAVTTTDGSPQGNFDITFTVTSPTTGATNSKLDRVVVALKCDIGISPASQQQVQAGGNIDYVHTFTNNSNASDTFTFGVSLSDTAWSSLIVAINDDSSTFASGTVIDAGATVTLASGQSISFTNRVFAPADAISGQTEVSTVTLTPTGSCGAVSVEDVASVIVGQVRLEKLVSIDDTCDCVADDAFATAGSAAIQPGDCAVWQLTATNEGDEDADSVVIRDSLTEYTAFVNAATDDNVGAADTLPGEDDIATTTDSSFSACKGTGCTLVSVTAAGGVAGGVTVSVAGEAVSFDAGTLTPGESAVGQFCVQVQ